MGATSKWVQGVTADAPLRDAAGAIVRARLDAVADRMGAARADPANADAVHQLRVATRRAGAALEALGEAFHPRALRKTRRRLKGVRRAAGAARDIDVHHALLTRMRRKAPDEQKPVIDLLIRSLETRRGPAAKDVAAATGDAEARRLRKARKALLSFDGVDEDERTMLDAARGSLTRLAQEARAMGAGDLSDPERLHELRIAGKRLRYAMEVFACCFPAELRERLYPRLEEAQEALGAVNDCQQMAARLEMALSGLENGTWGDGHGPPAAQVRAGLTALLAHFRRQRDDRAAGFAEWWGAFVHDGFFETLFETIGAAPAILEAASAESAPREAISPDRRPAASGPTLRRGRPAEPVESLHAEGAGAWSREDRAMRLAAIDVGTNSIRLLVAEAYADGSYRILDDEKEVTRLGRGLATTGSLEPISMQQSALAVARMKSIAEGYNAATIRIVGTCAVREAANGEDFLEMIRSRAGMSMEILSAQEEAKLSHLSAAHAFDLRATPAVVADIGGGSTELILSAGGVIERIYTLSLGAVRLTEQFGGPEAAAGERFDEMRAWIKGSVRSVVEDPPFLPQMLIGAGGTFESLAKVAMQREQGAKAGGAAPLATVRGYDLRRKDVKRLMDWLRAMPLRERAKVPGLSPQRAEIIVAGAAIVCAVMKRLEVNHLRVHDGGIRDGLLLTMLADLGGAQAEGPRGRSKSVRQFASSCNYERRHCFHVTRLALQVFDQLAARRSGQPAPWMEPASRTLLEAAAILHDVGYHINYDKHHLHSYHLIVHADLAGFSRREVELIANIARYHRGSEPKATHPAFAALSKGDRELVRKLSAILRLADGLDRTHMQNVRSVELSFVGDNVTLALDAERDPAVDVWGSERKGGLFIEEFGLTPRYQWPAGTAVAPKREDDDAAPAAAPRVRLAEG
ncbi:MAG: CHAD domain-containing protein [Phycisphaerales bacterium]|nr:CHAD domain-containing protein [Phycisphaerales bacterium]